MFSDEEGESDGLHSDDEREHVESMTMDDSAMEDSQPAAALEQEAPGQPEAPAGPVEPLTSAGVATRASTMFVVGSAEPRASGLAMIGKVPTKELVQLAFVAANELCDTHGKALSKSFGNFDRVVALGWLIGDAVGKPLLRLTLSASRRGVSQATSRPISRPSGRTRRATPASLPRRTRSGRRLLSRRRLKKLSYSRQQSTCPCRIRA